MSEIQSGQQQGENIIQTGVISTFIVLSVAGLIIGGATKAAGTGFFLDWVGTFFVCGTPFQIMMAVVWGNQFPDAIGRMNQPLKGVALTAMFFVAGAIVMPILLFTVGQGVLTPMLIHYAIQSVGVTLLVILVFGCWPISRLTDDKLILGLATLVYIYILNFIIFKIFYEYGFFAGAPFYSPELDPGGLFNGMTALTFAVTVASLVLVFSMFETWPVSKIFKDGIQPASGLLGTVIILMVSAVLYFGFTTVIGMEPMDFMVRGPVCIIFGTFLVDNMMQFQLFSGLQQPLKGIMKSLICLVGAVAMYYFYAFVLPFFVGHELEAGPAAEYAQEIWIATAMLGITFPVINLISGAFDFWPVKRKSAVTAENPIAD